MEDKKSRYKRFSEKIRKPYRLVILNDATFEERFSFRLTRLNVFTGLGIMVILLFFLSILLIALTPLREYIPGYGSGNRKDLYELKLKTDSLEHNLELKALYISDLNKIISGEAFDDSVIRPQSEGSFDTITLQKSYEDSMLRLEMESLDEYSLSFPSGEIKSPEHSINRVFFFPPLKGFITNHFNPLQKHYGVDIVSEKNEAIKATLDGIVIFSSWTLEGGYTIAIQHPGNIVSVYKHNSALLKTQGTAVKSGEVIAIVGESGTIQSGPHLHFELWHNGNPVNPVDYIRFE